MKKKIGITLAIIVSLLLIASLGWHFHRQNLAKQYQQTTTPTLFFHGYGSSANAETKMTHAAKRAGVTQTIVRANVSNQGKVTFNQHIPAHAVNPIVEVNLADKTLANAPHSRTNYASAYPYGARYVAAVINALEKQHHYRSVNLVGHFMGNLEIIYYLKAHTKQIQQGKLPAVKHYVAIAGHFDGILGMNDQANSLKIDPKTGKPSKMAPEYKALLPLRQTFPHETKVLNIFGNLEDGSNSDGDVSTASARSLRYLINHHASYQELKVRGKQAQHSQLHNGNHQVDQALINFLWKK
ncbi:MAG: alpha/beta hydrolase [Lactobacillus sp.]|jgi:uncharacterized alpha/beta hydrolase family protein|nr:alpha/beta hydrolase [Lactobacillus sp.]